MRTPLLLVAVLAACDQGEKLRVFTDDEIAAMAARAEARVAKLASVTCPRPVLRGVPVPGPAAPDIAKVLRHGPEVKACYDKVSLLSQPKGEDLIGQRSPALVAIEAQCGALLETLVSAAIAHEDACSPNRVPNVRFDDPNLPGAVGGLLASKLLVLRAGLRADAGDARGALWLLADTIRFAQDMSRGPTYLTDYMAGAATIGIALREVSAILSSATLDATTLAELTAAFDALVATEPLFGEVMAGEHEFIAVDLAPQAKGDERGGLYAIAEHLVAKAARVCPPRATMATCWRGYASTKPAAVSPQEIHVGELVKRTRAAHPGISSEAMREQVKQQLLENAERMSLFQTYLTKRAAFYSSLVGARIALEAERLGRCPTLDEIADLRSPPRLGDKVEVEISEGMLTVRAPAWARDDRYKPWTSRCEPSD